MTSRDKPKMVTFVKRMYGKNLGLETWTDDFLFTQTTFDTEEERNTAMEHFKQFAAQTEVPWQEKPEGWKPEGTPPGETKH